MSFQVDIERLIAAIELLNLVQLLQTTDKNGHSVPHCSYERFGRVCRFSGRKIREAFQFTGCPGNLHARKQEFRGNAFEARKDQFLPLAGLSLTENAMTTLSFPYSPAE